MIQDSGSQGRSPPHLRVTVGVTSRRERSDGNARGGIDRGAHRHIDDAVGMGLSLTPGLGDGIPRKGRQAGRDVTATHSPCGGRASTAGGVLVGRAKPRSATRGSQLVKELGVDVEELLLVAGQVILVVDGLDGAHGLTGAAVNALLRVNVKLRSPS